MINGEETHPQFKERIIDVAKVIIENGLTIRDGHLCFGLKQDMPIALAALATLQNETDLNRMRHSNDSFVSAIGAFVCIYQKSQMGTEKNQAFGWALQGLDVKDQLNKMAQSDLRAIQAGLNNMYDRGFDGRVQPRRWDSCGDPMGRKQPNVPAQVSLWDKARSRSL